jgi:tetratricopeptide (TPR) repeat protein
MRSVFTLAVLLTAAASTLAQEKSWLGAFVLPTKPAKDIKLRVTVGTKEVSFPFSDTWPVRVRDDRGGSIKIHDNYREGWVDKADFVLAKEAPAYFDRRVQANPKDTYALFMRGIGFLLKREFDKAINDFDDCIRLAPTVPAYFNSRGNTWLGKKEYDKAIADYNETIRLNAKWALPYHNRGSAWNAKKEYIKAIADYNKAMLLDPKYLPTLQGAAWLLATCPNEKVRNGKRAVELAKKAQDANKEDPITMDILAAAYACAGNFKEAVRWEERALSNEEFRTEETFFFRLELYRKMQPYVQK